jgi:hypothetical protein
MPTTPEPSSFVYRAENAVPVRSGFARKKTDRAKAVGEKYKSIFFRKQNRCDRAIRFRDNPNPGIIRKPMRGENPEAAFDGEFILRLIMFIEFTPCSHCVLREKGERRFAGTSECFERAGCRNPLAEWETFCRHNLHPSERASRKGASLAVARYCGTGSSAFSADVNAFDRLHIVRGANSSCSGLKYSLCTGPAKCFGRSISASMNAW